MLQNEKKIKMLHFIPVETLQHSFFLPIWLKLRRKHRNYIVSIASNKKLRESDKFFKEMEKINRTMDDELQKIRMSMYDLDDFF